MSDRRREMKAERGRIGEDRIGSSRVREKIERKKDRKTEREKESDGSYKL